MISGPKDGTISESPEKKSCGSSEQIDNPVWEDISPIVWRNSIYSEDAKTNCMGELFSLQVQFFKDFK